MKAEQGSISGWKMSRNYLEHSSTIKDCAVRLGGSVRTTGTDYVRDCCLGVLNKKTNKYPWIIDAYGFANGLIIDNGTKVNIGSDRLENTIYLRDYIIGVINGKY